MKFNILNLFILLDSAFAIGDVLKNKLKLQTIDNVPNKEAVMWGVGSSKAELDGYLNTWGAAHPDDPLNFPSTAADLSLGAPAIIQGIWRDAPTATAFTGIALNTGVWYIANSHLATGGVLQKDWTLEQCSIPKDGIHHTPITFTAHQKLCRVATGTCAEGSPDAYLSEENLSPHELAQCAVAFAITKVTETKACIAFRSNSVNGRHFDDGKRLSPPLPWAGPLTISIENSLGITEWVAYEKGGKCEGMRKKTPQCGAAAASASGATVTGPHESHFVAEVPPANAEIRCIPTSGVDSPFKPGLKTQLKRPVKEGRVTTGKSWGYLIAGSGANGLGSDNGPDTVTQLACLAMTDRAEKTCETAECAVTLPQFMLNGKKRPLNQAIWPKTVKCAAMFQLIRAKGADNAVCLDAGNSEMGAPRNGVNLRFSGGKLPRQMMQVIAKAIHNDLGVTAFVPLTLSSTRNCDYDSTVACQIPTSGEYNGNTDFQSVQRTASRTSLQIPAQVHFNEKFVESWKSEHATTQIRTGEAFLCSVLYPDATAPTSTAPAPHSTPQPMPTPPTTTGVPTPPSTTGVPTPPPLTTGVPTPPTPTSTTGV